MHFLLHVSLIACSTPSVYHMDSICVFKKCSNTCPPKHVSLLLWHLQGFWGYGVVLPITRQVINIWFPPIMTTTNHIPPWRSSFTFIISDRHPSLSLAVGREAGPPSHNQPVGCYAECMYHLKETLAGHQKWGAQDGGEAASGMTA